MSWWSNRNIYYQYYRRRRRMHRAPLPYMTDEEKEEKYNERMNFMLDKDFFYVNGLKHVYISNCGFYLITYRRQLGGETSKGKFIVFNKSRWYTKDFLEHGKRRIQGRTREKVAKDLYFQIHELA